MFELKVLTHFAAAHQLKMVTEKCENLHGHNWKIEVCVNGRELHSSGVLMDFGELKAHVRTIIERLDHQFLNELEYFANGLNPSSENIAVFIAGQLSEQLKEKPVFVSRVSVWESDNACATYYPQRSE
ncbi:MAG: 6-carboxytetrahydropterin synthase QueD [Desulfosudaceae bacterium]